MSDQRPSLWGCAPDTRAAHLVLFIDRGSGGTPGLVVAWDIKGSPHLTQSFDGTHAAVVDYAKAEASDFASAVAKLEHQVLTNPFFQWLQSIPRATRTQVSPETGRRICTWGCTSCMQLTAQAGHRSGL